MALDSDVQTDLQYTQATSLSDLFAADIADAPHAFILNYPVTASWAAYPDTDGQLHAIDANFRVSGSTPLCLQRLPLLKEGKAIAKYSTDYRMDGTLDSILVELKPELDRKDFLILSALEKVKYGKIYTALYGIVAGETLTEMQQIEQKLQSKGLMLG